MATWANGQMADGGMTGYRVSFRKDGTTMRPGYFENGEQVGEWTTRDRAGKIDEVTRRKPQGKRSAGRSARRSR